MKYFDYGLDSGFSPPAEDFDIDEFLKQSQQQEEHRLETELTRIKEQLEQRDRIHENSIVELESKLERYINRLELLYRRMDGSKAEKEQLKQRIEEFYRSIRKERRQHWRDRQELEKERRGLLRELEELNDTSLSDLL